MSQSERDIKKTTLANGLTVVTEEMAGVRSVSVGVWVVAGSRTESAALNGISHFIEHMVFKGTETRSQVEIAREGDALGGTLDAFTAKEVVCFNAKVLDEHLPRAFDVIADLVLAPLFRTDDIGKEQSVVLEEIKMDEDNPDSLVHELYTQNVWQGHALGRPILGTRETLAGFDHDAVVRFFRQWYVPNQMIVAAAGRLDHDRFVALVGEKFLRARPHPNGYRDQAPQPQPALTLRHKNELEQVHLCVGVPSYPLTDERRYITLLLNTILGGGMSSRLFQNIREREGLAYSIFSDLHGYRDAGLLTVYAGTAQGTARRTLDLILHEFRRLKREPVAADELRRAKDNLKATLMFSLESSSARMANLARQQIYFGRFLSLDEILASIEAVTAEQIEAAAKDFFQPANLGVSVLGRLDGFQLDRKELVC